MKGIIYCIKNQINEKMYIGQTINPKRRKREFYSENSLYTSKDIDHLSKIDKARRKYGVQNFEYSILETIEKENKKELVKCLDTLEDNYIAQYDTINNGYNTIKGGSSYIHRERNKNCSNKGGVSKMDIKLNPVCKIYKSELNNLIPKEITVLATLKLSSNGIMSYTKLSEILSISVNNLKNIIRSLEEKGFIIINKYRNSYKYNFKDFDEHFEPFSYDFLDKPDLTFTEKSYIVATQQYMFKDSETLEGKVSFSNKELSALIKMSPSTITRCNHTLEKKGYLEGATDAVKRFQLRELDQMIIWKLQQHEEQIQKNTEDIAFLKKEVQRLTLENEKLRNRNNSNTYIL